jgi:Relaxase/Mobilisation nuclease domain
VERIVIVGFSKYGTGGGYAPMRYFTSYTNRDGSLRTLPGGTPAPPAVLRGDPELVRHLIDGLKFKHTYTSGVLSFAPGEVITPEMEEEIMDAFETAAFAGLAHDQYSILWVRHTHAGHHELNFLIPRVELSTGKSLNIRPPGAKAGDLFDSFRSMINARYGLADPDDPARAQDVSMSNIFAKLGVYDDAPPAAEARPLSHTLRERVEKGHQAGEALKGPTRLREDLRQAITAYVRDAVENGSLADRDGVAAYLEAEGLTVTRATKSALTVLVPGTLDFFAGAAPQEAQKHAAIRLKGGLYSSEAFNARERTERPKRYARPDPTREAQFAEQLERLTTYRAAYHRQRYGARQAPEPLPIDRSHPEPQIEPLADYTQRVLGDEAILASREATEDAPSTERQRRRQEMREEEEALARGHHQRRHL